MTSDETMSQGNSPDPGDLHLALERAAHEWRVTFDAMDDPVVVVDGSGCVKRLNQAARALTDRSYPNLLGCNIETLGTGLLWPAAAKATETARVSDGRTESHVGENGSREAWVIKARPVRGRGIDTGSVIVIAHDVAPLVKLQNSLRRGETLATMGNLVDGVAHEVRNPLFSMSATLDALEARGLLPEGSGEHVGVLRDELNRMGKLLQELLDYGKPAPLNLKPDTIDGVLEEAVKANAALAEADDVHIETVCAGSLPVIHMDRSRLVRAVANLVSNSIQHSPGGGTVSVRAHLVLREGCQWIETIVTDGGPGFDPCDLQQVFEPFFTRRQGGTGLGLSIVQRIVEQHGGTVSAANAVGGGATLRLTLPAAANQQTGRVSMSWARNEY